MTKLKPLSIEYLTLPKPEGKVTDHHKPKTTQPAELLPAYAYQMTKNWHKLQREFTKAHRKNGISVVDWCAAKGLNYHTARRHIKLYLSKQSVRTDHHDKQCWPTEHNEQANCKTARQTKQNCKRGAPFGNTNAIKHGGYSKAVINEIRAIYQPDEITEIELIKPRIIAILIEAQRLDKALKKANDTQTLLRLLNIRHGMDQAIDKLIGRKIRLWRALWSKPRRR